MGLAHKELKRIVNAFVDCLFGPMFKVDFSKNMSDGMFVEMLSLFKGENLAVTFLDWLADF